MPAAPAPPSTAPLAPSLRPAPAAAVPQGVSAVATSAVSAARTQELIAELGVARRELGEKSIELRKLTHERNVLRTRVLRAEASARELGSALRAESQLRSEFAETHAASNAALRVRIAELESALASAKTSSSAQASDLRRIRGIGPGYERALIGLGISQAAQIAALSAAEIARIAPLIKTTVSRIEREDWLGQARRLATNSEK